MEHAQTATSRLLDVRAPVVVGQDLHWREVVVRQLLGEMFLREGIDLSRPGGKVGQYCMF